jgi:two-component system, cell cycle sensor histidine kinase and response regulator CckA
MTDHRSKNARPLPRVTTERPAWLQDSFYTATESVVEGVIAVDAEGRILAFNAPAERLVSAPALSHGMPVDEALALFSPSDESLLTPHPVLHAIASGTRVELPALVDNVRGHALVDLLVLPVTAHGDTVSGAIVALRTTRADREPPGARRASMSKAEAVGRIAGSVAHDFSSVLTLVLGNLDLLLESHDLPNSQRELIAEIHEACNIGVRLAHQLLAFSRSQPLDLRPTNINAIIEKDWPLFGRVLGTRIMLARDLDEALPFVRADPAEMERVLLNLITNARDALGEGGQVFVTTRRRQMTAATPDRREEMAEGEYAMLTVADTGTGVDEETLQRLFEPYFTTKTLGRGTGLGLATVYGIVKQIGGYIYVTSHHGKGTKFSIFLPADVRG